MITYTIYCHTFPNGKMYFGQTCQDPEKRWGKNGYGYRHQELIYRAICKYGWENIDHRIISIGLDKDEADFQEMFYISAYRTNEIQYGYNKCNGGGGSIGYKHTEETKKKISEDNKGKEPWNKGKHLAEETKKKISKIKKGNTNFLGKHHTPETKKKIGTKAKDRFVNKENHPMIGKHHTEESKKKISESKKGKSTGPLSEETKLKISISKKGIQKPKYKWLTPNGEIKEMDLGNVGRHHPDWIKIEDI